MRRKSGSMPAQWFRKGLCELICMKEYDVQGKLADCENDWKLHVKVQNENEATFWGRSMNMPIEPVAAAKLLVNQPGGAGGGS